MSLSGPVGASVALASTLAISWSSSGLITVLSSLLVGSRLSLTVTITPAPYQHRRRGLLFAYGARRHAVLRRWSAVPVSSRRCPRHRHRHRRLRQHRQPRLPRLG